LGRLALISFFSASATEHVIGGWVLCAARPTDATDRARSPRTPSLRYPLFFLFGALGFVLVDPPCGPDAPEIQRMLGDFGGRSRSSYAYPSFSLCPDYRRPLRQ